MEFVIKSPKYGEYVASVDDEDYDKVKQYHWTLDKRDNGRNYARASIWIGVNKFSYIYLHRLIMGHPEGCVIDHKDNNGLNNVKSNLRLTPHIGGRNSQNRGKSKNSKQRFKGVHFYTKGQFKGRYSAKIIANGNKIWGGYFDNEIEAAHRVNELCLLYHQEFANLNPLTEEELEQLKYMKTGPSLSKLKKYEKKLMRGVQMPIKAPVSKPYMVNITVKGVKAYLGYFKTEIDAAKAYNEALIKMGGNLKLLNKIPE